MKIPRYLLLLVASCYVTSAAAFDFLPTETEWQAWPNYCRARYVTLPIASASPYSGQVSSASIDLARQQLGDALFDRVQHYCAGAAWVMRAKYEPDKNKRQFYYRTALTEANYTYSRGSPSDPYAPNMLIAMANAAEGLGEYEQATNFLTTAIEAHPTKSTAYIALGILYRKRGNLKQAKETLLKGDAASGNSEADIAYNLGLILFDLGEHNQAVEYAQRAYKQGYPLPGLRNKLSAKGLWGNR